jgi:hypothetical protein
MKITVLGAMLVVLIVIAGVLLLKSLDGNHAARLLLDWARRSSHGFGLLIRDGLIHARSTTQAKPFLPSTVVSSHGHALNSR